jgi:hypothetical protein
VATRTTPSSHCHEAAGIRTSGAGAASRVETLGLTGGHGAWLYSPRETGAWVSSQPRAWHLLRTRQRGPMRSRSCDSVSRRQRSAARASCPSATKQQRPVFAPQWQRGPSWTPLGGHSAQSGGRCCGGPQPRRTLPRSRRSQVIGYQVGRDWRAITSFYRGGASVGRGCGARGPEWPEPPGGPSGLADSCP